MISFTTADASGHTFANSAGNINLWVVVNKPTSIALTMEALREGRSGLPPDEVITISGNGMTILSSFAREIFTSRSTGLASFTIDSVTNVTLAAVCAEQYRTY